jgi:hypothetical protein
MKPLYSLIDASKALVEYFKRINLNSTLQKTLIQENATRWNSLLRCLNSIDEMFEDIVTILTEKKSTTKIADLDKDILRNLIDFLEPFS